MIADDARSAGRCNAHRFVKIKINRKEVGRHHEKSSDPQTCGSILVTQEEAAKMVGGNPCFSSENTNASIEALGKVSQPEAAKLMNVSRASVQRAKKIMREAARTMRWMMISNVIDGQIDGRVYSGMGEGPERF